MFESTIEDERNCICIGIASLIYPSVLHFRPLDQNQREFTHGILSDDYENGDSHSSSQTTNEMSQSQTGLILAYPW